MITKPEEHEIDRTGKRLLRAVLEPLTWVVNDVGEDYGIDCNVQVFDNKFPTGTWFHVQLKSSASSRYSADHMFVSQELSADHARHYALQIRQPLILIHVDVSSGVVYWHAPQLDRQLQLKLGEADVKSVRLRIPSSQQLPGSAADLLMTLEKIYLALAIRTLSGNSTQFFAESLTHFPDQENLYRSFHEKNDTLRLRTIRELFEHKKYDEARARTNSVLDDSDSTVELKFWAEIQLEAIDYAQMVHSGKPQVELARLHLAHAKSLQKLTTSGPKQLKFYALIGRRAAELEILTHESVSLYMAMSQHLRAQGNPMMALGLYARRSEVTRSITLEYNRCVRLARYAANYPNRWVLGRALANIPRAIGPYMITLRSENKVEVEQAFAQSALQVCKLAMRISKETGDSEGVVLAILSALMTADSPDSEAYRWATQTAESLVDAELRADALLRIDRALNRWEGKKVKGDYHGDVIWQAIQNVASAIGIDTNNESDPVVLGLRIAAKDDSPERILAQCESLLVSSGATGPIARKIQELFNISTAGSKVIHCTLHNFHVEGREQDMAYDDFRRTHCESCPDKKPRPDGWRYTDEVRDAIQTLNYPFVARLVGTPHGIRYTDKD